MAAPNAAATLNAPSHELWTKGSYLLIIIIVQIIIDKYKITSFDVYFVWVLFGGERGGRLIPLRKILPPPPKGVTRG